MSQCWLRQMHSFSWRIEYFEQVEHSVVEEQVMQFLRLHSKLDTDIDIDEADPLAGVAVTINVAYEVPLGRVPSIVNFVVSKDAHEGIDALPMRVTEYETGRHCADASESNYKTNGHCSCTGTKVCDAVRLREQVMVAASVSENPDEELKTWFVLVVMLIPGVLMAMSEVAIS